MWWKERERDNCDRKKDTKMRKCAKETQVGRNVECMADGNN